MTVPVRRVLLLSTYELGHQPLGLAAPARWLRDAGLSVECRDLSRERLDPQAVHRADLVALHVPMHTATRIGVEIARRVRAMRPGVRLCFYGLYAPLCAPALEALGDVTVLGGELEPDLVRVALGETPAAPVSLARIAHRVPDRTGLPSLEGYAKLADGERLRTVGYVEASRGCKHRCRHCPVVPIYEGRFRIVDAEVVLADVAEQVAAGAEHITFGDPDFLNGPKHALRIVRALHARFPSLTYDVTVKVEHLLRHRALLPELAGTGCVLVTSAVESFDDRVLARLEKGHTRADIVEAVRACREAGLSLGPTFVAFHPWTSLSGYTEMLDGIDALGLVDAVAPVQLTLRLLVTARSRLLELPGIASLAGAFDPATLTHPWRHPDPEVDALWRRVTTLVEEGEAAGRSRRALFDAVRDAARRATGDAPERLPPPPDMPPPSRVPYLTEPWYC